MKIRTIAAAAVAVAGTCAFGAAQAAPASNPVATQGTIGADYTYTGYDQGIGNSNTYGGEVAGITPFGSDWSGQLSGAYHANDFNNGGPHLSDWNVAGTISWNQHWGRLGANVGYDGLSGGGAHINVTNYGVYGLYYPNAQWTLGLRGGGFSANAGAFGFGGSQTGGYVGGEVAGYATPNLEIQGDVNYAGVSGLNQTTAGLRGEWLISQTTPFSVWAGYTYTDIHFSGFGSVTSNAGSFGVKYYFGGMPSSLVDRRRSGVDEFGPATVNFITF